MPRREKPPNTTIHVDGKGNVVAMRDVVQYISAKPPIIRAEVQPGDAHITDAQAAELQELVRQIVEAEAVRRVPGTFATVWSALNKAMKVPRYRLIPLDQFPKAKAYLQRWRARLMSTSTAAKRMPADVRKRQIAYIHVNMGQGLELQVREYVAKNFHKVSIGDLTEAELKRTYSYVAGLKRRVEKS